MLKKYSSLNSFLKRSKKFIISGHENPDPDCICSAIALEYLLVKLKKEVLCINADPTPLNLIPLDYRLKISSLKENADLPDNLKDYSLVIVDTNDFNNIGEIKNKIIPHVQEIFIIDHHSYKLDNIKEHLLEISASSTCEIIYGIYKNYKIKIPKEVGDAIYAGILFDSGSFHYPKTSAYTFNIAAEITKNGTNPNWLYFLLYENESIGSLKILSLVLATLELHHNNTIAILTMTKETLKKSGAKYEECSPMINLPLRSHKVKASIFFKENLEGVKRVSIRSKGNIDVAKLSMSYGGGGHKNAAGFKIKPANKTFLDVRDIILNYLIEEIDKK